MKKMSNILITLIVLSSINILSESTNINPSDLFTSLYANNHENKDSNTMMLSHSTNPDMSIAVKKGTKVRVNRKLKQYTFESYDSNNRVIILKDKKKEEISFYLYELDFLSFRLDELKKENVVGGIAGGIALGYLGMWPSAMAGCLLNFGLGWDGNYDDSLAGWIFLAVMAGGTYISAKQGYKMGKNIGNPYIHLDLNQNDGWQITSK